MVILRQRIGDPYRWMSDRTDVKVSLDNGQNPAEKIRGAGSISARRCLGFTGELPVQVSDVRKPLSEEKSAFGAPPRLWRPRVPANQMDPMLTSNLMDWNGAWSQVILFIVNSQACINSVIVK